MIAMDINDIRGVGTVAALLAFLGVVWWAYGPSRKQRFEEDGNLPFAEDDQLPKNHDTRAAEGKKP